MRHTLVNLGKGEVFAYVASLVTSPDINDVSEFLRLAEAAPIPGHMTVWYSTPTGKGAGRGSPAVTIGHDHNLYDGDNISANKITVVCSGTWNQCWPVFASYARLICGSV